MKLAKTFSSRDFMEGEFLRPETMKKQKHKKGEEKGLGRMGWRSPWHKSGEEGTQAYPTGMETKSASSKTNTIIIYIIHKTKM